MNSLVSYTKHQEAAFDELAINIWRSVVSETLPPVRHYKHWVTSRPAKSVGGDFQLAAANWVAVGDVSGKGVPAALLTGMFVAAFKLAVRSRNPAKALEYALFNELESANMFTTLAAVELGEDGWLNTFNLGHPPILIRRASGDIEELVAGAPPIGTFRLDTYPTASVRVRPGEYICLYTDGLLEANSREVAGEMFGLERLKAYLTRHTAPAAANEALLKAVANWDLDDDFTLVLLEYCPEQGWTDSRLDRR